MLGWTGIGHAAESLKTEALATDPAQFRVQVMQAVSRADALIAKLKGKPEAQAAVLDLMQTRDNILRELPKVETKAGDAKWDSKEMRESVADMLRLLKLHYEKAEALAG